jgi:signal transduction histidine kinase/CheY-like chemotaxis protein
MITREIDTMREATERWSQEMQGLQRGMLARYKWAMVGIGVCWLIWVSSPYAPPLWLGWGALAALGGCTYVASRVEERHYYLSSALLILGCLGVQGLLVAWQPESLFLAIGLVALTAACALLGTLAGLVVAAASYTSSLWLWRTLHGFAPPSLTISLALLYLLVWGSMSISRHPFDEALYLALSGWSRLRSALDEARERRGELHRTVRALEEATYRIERINNELLLARHQAELARVNKGRFAATVSHELRGPLNLILGFSKLMALSPERYGTPLPRAYHADIDAIYTSSQHVAALLDDILDLSQIEAEHMPLVRERIDLNEDVVREAVRTVALLAERKGLAIALDLQAGLPVVLADRVRLRQVLLNLLTNAVRFTDRGSIRVSTALCAHEIMVSVIDTGKGIAKEKMPRLFEEFYQLHLTEQQGLQGSGLGLAISKHLVELHGGRIWAESTEGEGTAFYFTLPLPEQALPAPRTSQQGERRQPEAHRTVLIVHDDPLVLRILARHLQGYQVIGLPRDGDMAAVVSATHPRAIITSLARANAVIAALAATPYDVPVLGCSMPDMNGGAPIEGAVAYLMKPVNQDIVHTLLRQLHLGPEPTVLIVDDEPDAVRLLEGFFATGLGHYRVLRAHGGQQALDIMRRDPPTVVFMDLVMPDLDGEATLRLMRADPQLATIPVVIVSGQDPTTQGPVLGTRISLTSLRPVEMADGVKRLRALLDVLSPSYLPDWSAPGPSAEAAQT